ncbi:hypothetical protein AC579_5926 [Pseudocercospora musae]|uniref:Uncharacterized protein n=1 Tax=Pseudocercospora musae TaxID=113226 RepID=A0A139ISV9_9PEZI|nr:hypothetical protein AC579_5926 [Pseudocercospora musae]
MSTSYYIFSGGSLVYPQPIMVYLVPPDRCFIFSLQQMLVSSRAIVLRDGNGAPQEMGFRAADCAGLTALFFVEKITALVQGINLEDRLFFWMQSGIYQL